MVGKFGYKTDNILEAKKLIRPDRKRQAGTGEKKMKIYKTQQEVESDIKDGLLKVDDDVKIECNIIINASIICWNLDCGDLHCMDLDCMNLDCRDLSYYAVAFAYESFKCKSIEGRRNNSKHFCLDSEVKITEGK